jgi:putative flavoprotein involved in K+ transport
MPAQASPDIVVVGAGQAGLSVSHELSRRGLVHLVLEGRSVAQAWRDRWDSFTLVTPNWTMDLPGLPYDGDDPEGFVPRDEVVAYLAGYAARLTAPVHEGVAVTALRPAPGGRLELETSGGTVRAATVVVCTGAFQRPHRPPVADAFPTGTAVLDAADYRRPSDLPEGRVLVVGSGQTGCQLAEDLHLAGRDVVLACGRAPWVPRRAGGHDIVTWLGRTAYFDQALSALPSPAARLLGNVQATGRDGGHDLHFRTLQAMGVRLTGHLAGVDPAGGRVRFAPDLHESVAFGDARYEELRALFAEQLPERGYAPPELPPPEPFSADALPEVDVSSLAAVVFTSGFRPDYRRWVHLPVFDDLGFPVTVDGATSVPGLYFCGVHFMRTRRSALLFGVGRDAAVVAASIAARAGQDGA